MRLDPGTARTLSEQAARLAGAGEELSRFNESSPDLASLCGIETAALEARLILSGGACSRVEAAAQATLGGKPSEVYLSDVSALSRLETVVSLGESRIGARIAAFDAAAESAGSEELGSFIGLASGVIGLLKSF